MEQSLDFSRYAALLVRRDQYVFTGEEKINNKTYAQVFEKRGEEYLLIQSLENASTPPLRFLPRECAETPVGNWTHFKKNSYRRYHKTYKQIKEELNGI